VGQGASTPEAAGQNAESATPAETGTDPSSIPIPDSTNQLPKDSTPSASAMGAGYNGAQIAAGAGETAGVGEDGAGGLRQTG
jgi:hypothetical protein